MGEFYFTIARKWGNGNLCIYTIHNDQVHLGTEEDAKSCLQYVLQNSNEQDYKIYRLNPEEIKQGA